DRDAVALELILPGRIIDDCDRGRGEHHDAPARPPPHVKRGPDAWAMLEAPAVAPVEVPVLVTDELPVLEAGAVVATDRPVPLVAPLRLGAGGERQTRQQAHHGQPEDLAFAEPHFRILLTG